MARFVEYRSYDKNGKCLSGLAFINGRYTGFWQGLEEAAQRYAAMTNAELQRHMDAFGHYDYKGVKAALKLWKRSNRGARIAKIIHG